MTATGTGTDRLGLFSLDADQAEVLDRVDADVVAWARSVGARPERHSELIPASTLELVDYFDSFPHLAHRVTPWMDDRPEPEALVATSAACYGAYFARRDTVRPDLELLTVRQVCRRREDHYVPLRRQREFQMREVVAIGAREPVEDFLRTGRRFVADLAASHGVTGGFATATDPFFRRDDPRRMHQRLFPTKEELVDDSGLAISSVNLHANFFGERCSLTLPDGSFVHTGCVAFGLERWVDALTRTTTEGTSTS